MRLWGAWIVRHLKCDLLSAFDQKGGLWPVAGQGALLALGNQPTLR